MVWRNALYVSLEFYMSLICEIIYYLCFFSLDLNALRYAFLENRSVSCSRAHYSSPLRFQTIMQHTWTALHQKRRPHFLWLRLHSAFEFRLIWSSGTEGPCILTQQP